MLSLEAPFKAAKTIAWDELEKCVVEEAEGEEMDLFKIQVFM
jgi:hypothetical protein